MCVQFCGVRGQRHHDGLCIRAADVKSVETDRAVLSLTRAAMTAIGAIDVFTDPTRARHHMTSLRRRPKERFATPGTSIALAPLQPLTLHSGITTSCCENTVSMRMW